MHNSILKNRTTGSGCIVARQSAQDIDTRTLILLALSATAGVAVEFYDFTIFGYAAASAFPQIFFPNLPPTQALVFSYLAYGAGYPSRLLGAFIFGHYGDRVGRKCAFLINLIVVGLSTCLTGMLPGYTKLGVAAPALLVVLRVIQGIALGGEFGGATSLLAEFAARRRSRAFWISIANLGLALGLMAGSFTFLALRNTFADSGWRVAMLLSAIIVIPALLARYRLADSPLFELLKSQEERSRAPSFEVFREHARPLILLAIVSAFQIMDSVVTGTYIVSFMHLAGIPLATTAVIIFLSRIGDVLGVLVTGPLADRLRRRKLAYAAIGISTTLSYPFALAIYRKQVLLVGVLQFLIVLIGMGVLHGLAPILNAESFPTKFRYSGSGISFNLAGVLGGMIAPPVLAKLIGSDVRHNWIYVPLVYSVYCAAAMIALLFIRETRDVRLEDLDVTAKAGIPARAGD